MAVRDSVRQPGQEPHEAKRVAPAPDQPLPEMPTEPRASQHRHGRQQVGEEPQGAAGAGHVRTGRRPPAGAQAGSEDSIPLVVVRRKGTYVLRLGELQRRLRARV